MALVQCEINAGADSIETGTVTSFYAPLPVTCSTVRKMFPFEGNFHFRVKVSGESLGMHNNKYLWMDLTEESEQQELQPLPGLAPGSQVIIYIQALALNLPSIGLPVDERGIGFDHVAAAADAEYLDKLGSEMHLRHEERPPRLEVVSASGASSFGSSSSSMLSGVADAAGKLLKKGSSTLSSLSESVGSINAQAGNLWGSVTSGVSSMFGLSNSTLSEATEKSLSTLSAFMEEAVDDVLLQALWSALSLDTHAASSGQVTGYERITPRWKVMGWQKDDPFADLKGTGSLALRCMLHMSRRHPAKSQEMLARNVINQKSKYPFAIVGVNITLLLADVLQLKGRAFASLSATVPYWTLFEDPTAFYELFSISFIFMDALWTSTNAVRADFGKLTTHVKTMVTKILNRGPTNVQEFRALAIEEGVISAQ